MSKRYLVALSGGVDSTYLVNRLLSNGHNVTTYYCEMKQNVEKTKREIKSISKISEYFRETFKDRYTHVDEAYSCNTNLYGHKLGFHQMHMLIHSLFVVSCSLEIDIAAIGYIMSDDATAFLDDIVKAYKSMFFMSVIKPIKIEFPLSKIGKCQTYYDLPIVLRDMVTWCEDPYLTHGYCGKCIPCKKMKSIDAFTDLCSKDIDRRFYVKEFLQ